MSQFKCKMCGGTLEIQSGSTVAECEYCGAKQTLPKLDDEKRANLYDRANHFRRSNEFDKASAIYEQILAEDNTDAETYWSLVLCRYGIEYVEDPLSHRRVPTVHRAQFTSIFDDDNYKSALKNSDTYQRVIYEEEAKAINEIQKGILAISQKEEPFDIFICYKETDESGKRTHDSVLAQDLYYQLKQEGFKVFFARITLEDKLGSAYEPYIFAALNSAKVMVVLGTKPEFFNAVWVKNEWSRFLSLIKNGEKKMLIPAYKDMDPYNLPKEFSHLQAQDMSKLGFMQDLIRGIKKILGYDKKPVAPTVTERVVVQGDGHAQDTAPLLRRAFLFLEDGEFDNASEYAEKVLDINPECAEAYVVKLLIEFDLKKLSDLAQCKSPISDSHNYQKAIRFASPEYRETIEGYNDVIIKQIDTARKDEVYARGVELMKFDRYDEAIQYFQKIPTYKDSTQKVDDCKKLAETERRDGIYQRATQLLDAGQFDEAARLFESIEDHKDSKEKIKLCGERKENARKNAIYSQAMNRVRSQNADDAAMKKSIEELQTISGYRDVDDQIRALNARLEKWYEDKKKAEEAARIKAEEDRRTREREAELRRIKAEKAKKTGKKVAKIGIPSVVALATLLILLFTLVIPLIRYNKADELFNAGKYDEAKKIYQDIGGFSDSEQRITVLDGIEMIDDTDFEEGIEKILSAGVPVKLTYGMGGGDFSGATYFSAPQEESDSSITLLNASTNSNVTSLAIAASVPETVEYTYNSSADFSGIQTPDRSGYRFVKWKLEAYTYQIDETFDIKLNAVWNEKEYIIEYDLNGAKVTMTTLNPIEYGIEDDSFTLINPTKTGYTFIGWTGTDLNGLTMSVTIEKGSVGDRSYEANWQANTYTITLNSNGGSVANTIINVTYDQKYTLPDPEWTGHTFCGWYEGNKKVTSGIWTRTTDLSLTAKWDIVEYKITYNMNYGTNSFSNPAMYTVDDEITLVSPTRTGYTFTGWTYSEQTTPVLNVTIPVGTTGDKTYTANWSANSFTLTFNADGGSVSPAAKTVTFDASFTLPIPTKNGYTFEGWFNDTKQYTNGTWKDTTNITLKAKWSANSYTVTYDDTTETRTNVIVTFNYNYSGSTSSTVTLTNGQTLNYPTVPTRSGYAFAGWYTNSSCTTQYNFSGIITEDITLYAKWVSMTSSYSSREYVDIANYNSSSSKKTISITTNSSSSRNYYYFTCYKSGSYTFYANHSSGDFYITVYNATQGTTIINNYNLYGSYSGKSATFSANAGDIIYVSLYNYSYGSNSSGNFYVSGASYPTSTAKASCSTVTGYVYDTSSTASTTVTFGSYHTLPTLTRTGYTFNGWYNGNTKVESGSWSIASNVTLVPKWQANTFTITFNPNGGSVSPTSQTVTYDSTYTLPTPTRTGYTFAGWYSGGTKYTGGTWKTASHTTLTASWTANSGIPYIVNHHKQNIYDDGYTIDSSATQNLTGIADASVTPEVNAYTGFTSPSEKTVTIKPDGSLVVDYYYTRNLYTLTMVTNGGESINAIRQKYQSALTMPDNATRTDYTFGGWFADADLTTAFTLTTIPARDIMAYAYWAEENKPGDFTYSGTSGITVSAYNGTSTTMWIPAYIGGVPVTTIPASAFENQTDLLEVVVPDTVTSIGTGAFNGCSSLTSISIPFVGASRTATAYEATFGYIYGYANSGEYGDSTYSSSTTYINLKYGTVTNGIWQYSCHNYKIKDILNHIYYYDTSYFYYIPTTITQVTITDQAAIPVAAFNNCDFIESITIPTTTTSVADYAFQNCKGLTEMDLGNELASVGQYAFAGCIGLESITVPDTVSSIGSYAFNGCVALKRMNSTTDGVINLPMSLTSISSYLFKGCSEITKVTMGDITFIGAYAFSGCENISQFNSDTNGELIVPSGVTTIGEYAFQNLSSITKIVVPDTVTSIGTGAFNGCSSLTSISIPFVGASRTATAYEATFGYIYGYANSGEYGDSTYSSSTTYINLKYGTVTNGIWQYSCHNYKIKDILNHIYYYDTSYFYYIPTTITQVTITDQAAIPVAAFNNCDFIESITIPTTTTSVADYAFQNCKGLTEMDLGNELASVGQYAFAGCIGLESITVPDTVSSIGSYAFNGCVALKRMNSTTDGVINLPMSLTSISSYLFKGCSEITKVTMGDITFIGAYAFSGCENISQFNSDTNGELIVPSGVTTIGEYAFQNLSSITKIVVPDTVTSIGTGAFNSCNAIEDITLPIIGKTATSNGSSDAMFGYIFGIYASSWSSTSSGPAGTVYQGWGSYSSGYPTSGVYGRNYTYDSYYYAHYYYIPSTIKNVTITVDTTIPYGAFQNCSFIETIVLPTTVTSVGEYAYQNCSATVSQTYETKTDMSWDGTTIATEFGSGDGSQVNPYIISTGAELALLSQKVNDGETFVGLYFKLAKNISLNGKTLTIIGSKNNKFEGIFDGNGFVISNFIISTSESYGGLFGYVSGTIQNLGVQGTVSASGTSGNAYVGMLAGYNAGTIQNCFATGSVNLSSANTTHAGGLVGYNEGNITNSYATTNVSSTSSGYMAYAGGLIGYSKSGTISGSYAAGDVKAQGTSNDYSRNGGLVGFLNNDATVINCYRSELQLLTRYDIAGASYCEEGTSASIETIKAYVSANWSSVIWSFNNTHPRFVEN